MDEVKVDRHTRAGAGGKDIFCPHCRSVSKVHHFSWSALRCDYCSEYVNKEDWLLKDYPVSYRGVAEEKEEREEPRFSPAPPMSPFESTINPSHYKKGKIEVIDFIIDQDMDYLTASCQKYLARWKHKNGVEDLKKCRWFLDKLIEQQEGMEDGSNPK